LLIVFLLLYFNTICNQDRDHFVGGAFSAIGAVWLLYLLNYNMSIAVWWLDRLAWVDAETASSCCSISISPSTMPSARRNAQLDDLREAIVNGAVKRLRPK